MQAPISTLNLLKFILLIAPNNKGIVGELIGFERKVINTIINAKHNLSKKLCTCYRLVLIHNQKCIRIYLV